LVRTSKFAPVAAAAISRVQEIASELADVELPKEAQDRALEEIDFHAATLRQAFKYRQEFGPPLGGADSESYFSEKLTGMTSFARMAIDPALRGGYEPNRIVDNVHHYSYLVSNLVAAPWQSRSKRPVSDRILKRSSSEHRDALKRLADR
jgi:hypothetical protein